MSGPCHRFHAHSVLHHFMICSVIGHFDHFWWFWWGPCGPPPMPYFWVFTPRQRNLTTLKSSKYLYLFIYISKRGMFPVIYISVLYIYICLLVERGLAATPPVHSPWSVPRHAHPQPVLSFQGFPVCCTRLGPLGPLHGLFHGVVPVRRACVFPFQGISLGPMTGPQNPL